MKFWLIGLLRAAWVSGTLLLIIASIPSSRLSWFHEALLGFAKRGKIMLSSSYKFTVPQRFFCHFYVVAVVWTALLLSSTWVYAYEMAPLAFEPYLYSCKPLDWKFAYEVWRSVFLLMLMEIQVLRRLIETVYVFKYSPSARMHIFGYLTGFFYTAALLSLCCSLAPELFRFAVDLLAEFIAKGKSQIPAFEFDWWEPVNSFMKLRWHQWIGAAIFLWGWMRQRRCHVILGSLREHAEQADEYVIPHGDWFEIVSSPHYLAEIVANLVFAAAETQRWYHHKFDNYPSNRYAIIPFVY